VDLYKDILISIHEDSVLVLVVQDDVCETGRNQSLGGPRGKRLGGARAHNIPRKAVQMEKKRQAITRRKLLLKLHIAVGEATKDRGGGGRGHSPFWAGRR